MWQEGPAFLKLPVESWPIVSHAGVTDLPERIKTVFVSAVDGAVLETLESRIDIKHFSKFQLLINTTARVIKLYERYSRLKQETAVKQYIPEITPDDREKAEKLWVVDSQKQLKASFDERKYVRLCPRYENGGVIVVGGRTERWMSSTWNRQNFVLLPHDHHLAYLTVLYEHQQGGHLGVAATISRVRMKYWILNIRMLTRKIVGSCVKCREKLKRFTEQVMNCLPIERMQPSPPFFTMGIDFFGSYTIRGEVQKRTRGKCFGVIIACNVSRAVYVDVSHNYSTDAFLQVLRRFSSLRGWPRKIHSDNGTQLVAASKELINAVKDLDWDMIKRYGIKYKTEWEFSPADAPWQNGATEALIKPIKRALNNAIGEEVMSFSEVQTVMFEAAQLVNQRPIGAHPTSPEESPYLCPNDLLLGRSTSHVPQGPFLERAGTKQRLDYIQAVVERFWKKWSRDVFPSLCVTPKWHVERRNVMEGDLVLVQDSYAVRGEWKRGLVTKVYPSDNGRVRRVLVSYKNPRPDQKADCYRGQKYKTVERAVQRLIVLIPVDEQ